MILRPQPGAARTATRAAALGLDPVVAPMFTVRALGWAPPDPKGHDAVLLTSANAASLAGGGLTSLLGVPCYAVGEATAEAAAAAGFDDVRVGPSDAAALLRLMEKDGVRRALHLSGREHKPIVGPGIVTRIPVYAADPVAALPIKAGAALRSGAVTLLHSPRAAAHFAALVDRAGLTRDTLDLATISPATADAAGEGWRSKAAADRPRDDALLELAAKLCKTGVPARGARGRG